MNRTLLTAAALLVAAAPAAAQGDPEVVAKIIEEGKERSQVWKTLTYISEEIGPRLTGSFGLERANVWAREQFTAYGLSNSHLHRWGEVGMRFDRGPCKAGMVEPYEREFEFTTRAWSAGTEGPVRGHVVKEPTTLEELAAVEDKLPGAWVLSKSRRTRRNRDREAAQAETDLREKIDAAMTEFGILGKLSGGSRDQVTTGGVRGWRELTMETIPQDLNVSIRRSDYDALNSLLGDGEEPIVEVDLKHYFTPGPIPVYNTIAEIPGTEFPDQVVIVSAHLDSWNGPGSMGTQDNGTGSSVTIEAARLLMAAGVQPRRTIRFCLWSGEEQGLLGSRAYVESLTEEELAGVSACFVDDGGTYYQGGLICTNEMLPMLEEATAGLNEAFPQLPIVHQAGDSMPRGGGSDHASFNRVGIPGFFWNEKSREGNEGMGYRFSWHTQKDTLEYAIEEYLVQSATCSAVTAYNLAMADTLLPRYVRPEEPAASEAPKEEAKPAVDPNFKPVASALAGMWDGTYTEIDMGFALNLEVDEAGTVQGSMVMMGQTRTLENGKWDGDTNELSFEYDAGETYGRLTAKAKMQENGSLKGDVRSSPESEGYPWVAKKKAETGGN